MEVLQKDEENKIEREKDMVELEVGSLAGTVGNEEESKDSEDGKGMTDFDRVESEVKRGFLEDDDKREKN